MEVLEGPSLRSLKKFMGNQQVRVSKQDLGTQQLRNFQQDFGTEHVLGIKHVLATRKKWHLTFITLLRRRVSHILTTDLPHSLALFTFFFPHFTALFTSCVPQVFASVTHFLPHSFAFVTNSCPHFSAFLIVCFPHFTGSGIKHKQYLHLEPLRPLRARGVPMFSSDASSTEHVSFPSSRSSCQVAELCPTKARSRAPSMAKSEEPVMACRRLSTLMNRSDLRRK